MTHEEKLSEMRAAAEQLAAEREKLAREIDAKVAAIREQNTQVTDAKRSVQ